MKPDFIAGYASALADLASEGDSRCVDWSAAYNYLHSRLHGFTPEPPKEFAGIQIVINPELPPGAVQIVHANGRVENFTVV